MRSWSVVPLVVFVAGCACDNVVVSTFPEDGATGVLANATLTATMTSPDPDVVVSVLDGAGNAVAGSTTIDSNVVTFVPDAPMAASTTHTMTVSNCAGDHAVSFTTSELGTPVADPASLVGGTWIIDFPSAREVNPPNVQTLLGALYTDFALAANVVSIEGSAADIQLAYVIDDPWTQDLCAQTIPLDTFDFTNPWIDLEADGDALRFSVGDVPTETLRMSGAFSADGETMEELYVHIVLDTRPIVPSIDPDPDASPTLACDFMSAAGVPCVECPSGAGPYCADIEMFGVTAYRDPATIVAWDADDVATQTCE